MEDHGQSSRSKLGVLLGASAILLVMGFCLASPSALWSGLLALMQAPALIDFDAFFFAGNLGTPFFNSGLLLLAVVLAYWLAGVSVQGVHYAAALIVTGFSFYGKNPLNIWFPVTGVLLYAKLHRKPAKEILATAFFATALSPVFGVLAFGTPALVPGSPLAIATGAIVAILGGLLMAALADFLPRLHHGRVLYNAGYADGITAVILNACLLSLGLPHERTYTAAHYTSGANRTLASMLLILIAYFFIAGWLLGGRRAFWRIITHRAKGGNFFAQFGFGATLMNIAASGALFLSYALLLGGQLNGLLFCALWTAMAFSACGVTPRLHLPLLLGVFCSAFLTGGISSSIAGNAFLAGSMGKVASNTMMMAAAFSSGIAPVAAECGALAGWSTAFLHAILSPTLGSLHGYMSLYNNAFSLGLLATFLQPFYAMRIGKREEAR